MKKVLIVISFVILLSGCGNNNKDTIIKKWSNKVDGMDSYLMRGTLEIYRNEDLYKYDLKSAYLKKDKFKVGLTNKTNNHEQIILKNEKGVYVVTPSLNKSFKFQSDWPYNNSQIYLLQPLLIDLKNDDKSTLEKKDGKDKIYLDTNLCYSKSGGIRKLKNILQDFSIDLNGINHLLPCMEIMVDYPELLTSDNLSKFMSIKIYYLEINLFKI